MTSALHHPEVAKVIQALTKEKTNFWKTQHGPLQDGAVDSLASHVLLEDLATLQYVGKQRWNLGITDAIIQFLTPDNTPPKTET